jgi:dienelactone hydrolase
MTEVILFHHALGLTPGMIAFADDLRAAGHTVHTPDVFEGRTFGSIEEGVGHAEEIGFGAVIERATRAAEPLPSDVVYAGFSLGVLCAQKLTQTRPGAKGALFYYSCVPSSEFGRWPAGVPAQIHGMDHDPIFMDEGDVEAARELAADNEGIEVFLYPGDQHYFADRTLATYDAAAAQLLLQRSLDFLAQRA